MSGWDERRKLSAALERGILDSLVRCGWVAHGFGQAQIPEALRELMRDYRADDNRPTLVRWLPDIIAGRRSPKGTEFVLIDAKCCRGPRYAIELSCIVAAEAIRIGMATPVFYVFDDGGVLTPADIRAYGTEGPPSRNGSGTPYMLVDRDRSVPFYDVFGSGG